MSDPTAGKLWWKCNECGAGWWDHQRGATCPNADAHPVIRDLRSEVASLRERAERAERRADAMEQTARDACGWPERQDPPSENRTWVEELAGFLRVTRGQRDAAWDATRAAEAESASLRSALEQADDWILKRPLERDGACRECFPTAEIPPAFAGFRCAWHHAASRVPPGGKGET